MNVLDNVSSEYKKGAATEVENELILNWYPKRILNRLSFDNPKSLLELGLGHGYTTNQFSNYFSKHTVLEGSSKVIEMFKSEFPKNNAEIIETYFEEFTDETKYDVIIMGFILEHVDDPAKILKIFKKNLRDNGRLFIAVPNAKSLNRRMGAALGKIEDIYSLNKNDLALGHKRNFCRRTLTHCVESQGYKVLWEEGIYLKPLPLDILNKLTDFSENLQAMCEVGKDFPDLGVGILMEIGL